MIVFHIKEIRIKKNISLRKLAELSEVSKSHIADIEKYKKMPSILILCRLADALEVNINELYTYKNEKS